MSVGATNWENFVKIINPSKHFAAHAARYMARLYGVLVWPVRLRAVPGWALPAPAAVSFAGAPTFRDALLIIDIVIHRVP